MISLIVIKENGFTGQVRDQYRKSFPIGDCQLMKIRSGMSQSMTENLDSEAGALPRYQFRKSRSMKLAVKDEVEGDWTLSASTVFSLVKIQINTNTCLCAINVQI